MCPVEVCVSLSDRDHLCQVETEPTKVLLLHSECKLWPAVSDGKTTYPP